MAVSVVGLALATSVFWGGRSTITKLGTERGGTPLQASLIVVTVSLLSFSAALVVGGGNPFAYPPRTFAFFAGIGVVGTAVARLTLYTGIQRVGASVNSAGNNTRPVFAVVLAVLFLGESLSAQTALGVVVVVTGLVTIGLSRGGDISGWRVTDLAFPLGAAFLFAVANVLRRLGLTTTGVSSLEAVAINEIGGIIGLGAYVLFRHRDDLGSLVASSRSASVFFAGGGILNALGLLALFEALRLGRVVVVDPISGTTSLFAIVFSYLFLGDVERITRTLVAGAALVIVGGALITGPEILGF